jgi:hypothetical protein
LDRAPYFGFTVFSFAMTNPSAKEKWQKVKEALEAAGKTNCHYYHRAVAITQGRQDPGPGFPPLGAVD